MYLSTIGWSKGAVGTDGGGRRRLSAVGANVFALGAVSLVTDVSAEMVTAVLPLYLVLGLHLGPAAYGVIDGTYTGATALLRIVGGYVADRTRSRKAVVGVGYALSAVAKLGLLAAGRSVAAVGLVIAVDRTGKGLRTAPRDALITLSTPPDSLGRAFGVHRAMDSLGAFLGPRLKENVECPSLSPDGTRIAFKEAIGADPNRGWRLSVLDLASMRVTHLAETRNFDDQAAWLDDASVAYTVRDSSGDPDVWSVPADGSGTPHLLVPEAESPAALGTSLYRPRP